MSDSGFDEQARDRFSNLYVWTRGHILVMNAIIWFYVPLGRRFYIASILICLFSSLIIGIATIPNTSPVVAISLFILAIFGETVLILCSEFILAPPVHLHLMSERHGGAIASFAFASQHLSSLTLPFIRLNSCVCWRVHHSTRAAQSRAQRGCNYDVHDQLRDVSLPPRSLHIITHHSLTSITNRSFIFVLLYFQCAPTHHGSHALKRGGFAAIVYTFFHCILGTNTSCFLPHHSTFSNIIFYSRIFPSGLWRVC
jgi:hypothetical protein